MTIEHPKNQTVQGVMSVLLGKRLEIILTLVSSLVSGDVDMNVHEMSPQ